MKKHVLLIDEDPTIAKLFLEAVSQINGTFKCTHANSAEKALQQLKYMYPHFVFVRYNLASYNGLHLLTLIKSDARLRRTKVFIHADNISEEVSKMARVLGAAGCLEKPDTLSRLVHSFRAIFAGDLLPDYTFLRKNQQEVILPAF